MDELRSCYSTECRFFRDDPRASTIHWYFVDENTPVLPFGTAFTSNEWLDVPEGDQAIGEVPGAARTWQNGRPPFPVAGDGHYCGTVQDFQEGGTVPDPPITLNVYGGPACCPTPPEPFVHFACSLHPEGAWSEYTLIMQGGTGIYVTTNGTFTLRYAGAICDCGDCGWKATTPLTFSPGPPPPIIWAIDCLGHPGNLLVSLWKPGTGFPFGYPLHTWDPHRLFVSPINGVFPPLNQPPPFAILIPGPASATGQFCPAQGAFLPTDLRVRWPAPGISISFAPLAQDSPMQARAACTYQGIILWGTRIPLTSLVPVFTPATLTFGPGGLITLAGSTPLFSPFSYTAMAPAWDLSPVALNLVGGPFPLFGLPASVLLYTQSDLPP